MIIDYVEGVSLLGLLADDEQNSISIQVLERGFVTDKRISWILAIRTENLDETIKRVRAAMPSVKVGWAQELQENHDGRK